MPRNTIVTVLQLPTSYISNAVVQMITDHITWDGYRSHDFRFCTQKSRLWFDGGELRTSDRA